MSILVDDDFSTYALGANPPYGALVDSGAVVKPFIANLNPGFYGDAQYVNMPSLQALQYPTSAPSTSLPAYTDFTLFMGMRLGGVGTDQQGAILQLNSNLSPFAGVILLTIGINNDGTFLVQSADGGDIAVSDQYVMSQKWFMLQVTAHFYAASGILKMDIQVAVNGVLAINSSLLSNRSTSSLPAFYWNNLLLGGCANGSEMGRVTIYDELIAIGTNPHPGTPEARVSQGVIELIRLRGTPVAKSSTRIYEA